MPQSKITLLFFATVALGSCTKKSPEGDILHVDQNCTFPKGFVPDPGDAGKKTLEGIDSDHDGLRDDVQRWIYARYPNDEPKKKALRQMALNIKQLLTIPLDEKSIKTAIVTSDRAVGCLAIVFPNAQDSTIEMEYLRAKFLNTKERTDQYLKTDAKFDGKTSGPSDGPDGTDCDK